MVQTCQSNVERGLETNDYDPCGGECEIEDHDGRQEEEQKGEEDGSQEELI